MIPISATSAKILAYLRQCAEDGSSPDRTEITLACDVSYSSVSHAVYALLDLHLIERDLERENGKYRYRLSKSQQTTIVAYHRNDEVVRQECDGVARTYAQMARYGY